MHTKNPRDWLSPNTELCISHNTRDLVYWKLTSLVAWVTMSTLLRLCLPGITLGISCDAQHYIALAQSSPLGRSSVAHHLINRWMDVSDSSQSWKFQSARGVATTMEAVCVKSIADLQSSIVQQYRLKHRALLLSREVSYLSFLIIRRTADAQVVSYRPRSAETICWETIYFTDLFQVTKYRP